MMTAKRWNEHVKLVVTALNTTAIGTFGLAVIAPIVTKLSEARGKPSGDMLSGLSFLKDVIWPALIAALVLHCFAHAVLSYLEPEG